MALEVSHSTEIARNSWEAGLQIESGELRHSLQCLCIRVGTNTAAVIETIFRKLRLNAANRVSETMTGQIKVARLREDQIDAATKLITDVFLIQLRVVGFGPDHDQQQSYRDGFLRLVRFFFAHGEPYAATIKDEVAGVALWMPPHTLETADEEAQEFGVTQLTDIFREPLGRLYELDRRLRDIRQQNMRAPHWFLALLNIAPERRGQGISNALLQPILLRADEGGLPSYAQTVLPDMAPFYERYGFEVLAQGVDPSSGAPWWALRREPKPLSA